MCEFKVKMISGNEIKDVCNDVLYAKIDENIVLRDVLGTTTTVENAIITEISVPSTKMTLLHSPILGKILKLLKLQNECHEKKIFDKKLMKLWEDIKLEGDAYINSLKKKFGK